MWLAFIPCMCALECPLTAVAGIKNASKVIKLDAHSNQLDKLQGIFCLNKYYVIIRRAAKRGWVAAERGYVLSVCVGGGTEGCVCCWLLLLFANSASS